MMDIDSCDTSPCFLCRHCLPGWKGSITAARQVLACKKGHSIFREGEVVRGIYFISAGAVKIHQSWGNGKDFILRFASKGVVIGHRGLGGGTTFPVSVTALDTTTVCFIDSSFLDAVFTANPPFVYSMMQLYASELQAAERRMRDLAVKPVKSRVAEALFAIRDVFGVDDKGYIRVPVTRLDIAAYSGTTYEAVFRLLSDWTGRELVGTSGKRIRIIKEDELSRFVGSDGIG
jgi:CRP/FNR family transcriptional regulator